MSTITLKQVSEFGFEAQSDAGWKITIDLPTASGGQAAGPTPTELVAIGLAACKGVTGIIWSKARQIKLQGLEIEVDYEMAENPRRIGAITTTLHHVKSQIDEAHLPRFEKALHACYVARTLEIPPKMTTVIE